MWPIRTRNVSAVIGDRHDRRWQKQEEEACGKWSNKKIIWWKTEHGLSVDKTSLNPPGAEGREQIQPICWKYPYSWWGGRRRCLCGHVWRPRSRKASVSAERRPTVCPSPAGDEGFHNYTTWRVNLSDVLLLSLSEFVQSEQRLTLTFPQADFTGDITSVWNLFVLLVIDVFFPPGMILPAPKNIKRNKR